jgi:5'-nucleotidase
MRILLTNDDGIHAQGLWALHDVFKVNHKVTVVAPDRECSAVGHGITLNNPLRVVRLETQKSMDAYFVNGTPADCVKLGIAEICDQRPELVISGINPGANVGVNLNYSGTVAAAKEAALFGIRAISVSMVGSNHDYYPDAARFVQRLMRRILGNGFPGRTFLNVNFPNLPLKRIKGVRLGPQGNDLFAASFIKRIDPRSRTYYWQGSESCPKFANPDNDGAYLFEDYIAITPVKCDMTDYATLEALKKSDLENLFPHDGAQDE